MCHSDQPGLARCGRPIPFDAQHAEVTPPGHAPADAPSCVVVTCVVHRVDLYGDKLADGGWITKVPGLPPSERTCFANFSMYATIVGTTVDS